ncbi:hypothetical protein MPNT_380001 [Candidatus Methylacidithermus pantelleriae]|uniref:Uncharacterized protein n=1 Tax=Candidatus Methylacidithermus pantelleriae TaxID=2744239 RepID=A0A8J2BP59_9BACT|nr:hypothetical protein MPNT_380001 [Candidatus Methylacidithermus pantelleriae]
MPSGFHLAHDKYLESVYDQEEKEQDAINIKRLWEQFLKEDELKSKVALARAIIRLGCVTLNPIIDETIEMLERELFHIVSTTDDRRKLSAFTEIRAHLKALKARRRKRMAMATDFVQIPGIEAVNFESLNSQENPPHPLPHTHRKRRGRKTLPLESHHSSSPTEGLSLDASSSLDPTEGSLNSAPHPE